MDTIGPPAAGEPPLKRAKTKEKGGHSHKCGALHAFVPRTALEQLGRRSSGQEQQPFVCVERGAALLMADISGFTALTLKCFEDGLRGIEIEARALNSYFVTMLSIFERFGGDTVKVCVLWGDLSVCDRRKRRGETAVGCV
jgi:class 3 adenylate cyclase